MLIKIILAFCAVVFVVTELPGVIVGSTQEYIIAAVITLYVQFGLISCFR